VTHTDKKKIIENLVVVPKTSKRNFWAREIKSLNILLENYPEDIFWKGLSFGNLVDSIIVFRSGFYSEELKKKYNLFKYKIPEEKPINIGKKSGEDYENNKKPKNLFDFLS
jgi:hypothetical protein